VADSAYGYVAFLKGDVAKAVMALWADSPWFGGAVTP